MKTTLPHDPLDDLIAAALHGELTPAERAAFELRLQNDPAARAAYQETQLMHDLLEKTHREAQPDPAFEQRMVSGVRRKIQHEEQHRETAWESVVALWRMGRGVLRNRWIVRSGYAVAVLLVLAVCTRTYFRDTRLITGMSDQADAQATRSTDANARSSLAVDGEAPDSALNASRVAPPNSALQRPDSDNSVAAAAPATSPPAAPIAMDSPEYKKLVQAEEDQLEAKTPSSADTAVTSITTRNGEQSSVDKLRVFPYPTHGFNPRTFAIDEGQTRVPAISSISSTDLPGGTSTKAAPGMVMNAPVNLAKVEQFAGKEQSVPTSSTAVPAPDVTRKLIRNAQLDLEVKSFPATVDQITALTKAAGGYVDTSNSQRGGNGKLQGTVVVKVLPQNLDDFLLKLRDVGELKNQSVSTEDVTKEYVDTQARLDNARRMETQLQALLARNNGKVSELLMVERELGRVRGDIEQMQGELKLYDFQVEYATVTLSVQEKDLTQAAAYLLKERDEFSLFATNVEATYNQARQATEACQAHILEAALNHNSGSDVSAMLVVSVPPGQIEAFLAQVKTLGRVDNFTRQTDRVARDGGDTDQPADQTKTENDRVLVHLSIRSDNDSRKQVAMTVVTSAVDDALDKAKTAALASAGAEVISSSINKTPEGPATAQLSVRVPGTSYPALLAAFRALGRTSSFSLQRDDNAGPNAAGDDAPVILSLTLTDDETPLQRTELAVLSSGDVDAGAQQLKKDAASNGVEIKASSFERTPDGRETAQMTFRLPMSKYPAFIESLKKLGRVESLSVNRQDQPDQARTDGTAPAEVSLQLHNEEEIVAEDNGIWATLRGTFGDGAAALLGSVRTIGVIVAFLVPWAIALGFAAWVVRRIYVARRK